MFRLSNRSLTNREGVDPKLCAVSDRAIQITMIDFGHGNDAGVRSAERQHELFNAGLSRADGYVHKSNHQPADDGYGKALDFYAFVDGQASWKEQHLAMVAAAFLQAASELGIQLQWGGLWKSSKSNLYGWDMPHTQLLE